MITWRWWWVFFNFVCGFLGESSVGLFLPLSFSFLIAATWRVKQTCVTACPSSELMAEYYWLHRSHGLCPIEGGGLGCFPSSLLLYVCLCLNTLILKSSDVASRCCNSGTLFIINRVFLLSCRDYLKEQKENKSMLDSPGKWHCHMTISK